MHDKVKKMDYRWLDYNIFVNYLNYILSFKVARNANQ